MTATLHSPLGERAGHTGETVMSEAEQLIARIDQIDNQRDADRILAAALAASLRTTDGQSYGSRVHREGRMQGYRSDLPSRLAGAAISLVGVVAAEPPSRPLHVRR